MLYAKSKAHWQRNLIPRSEKQDKAYRNPDNDLRGLWRPNNLAARNSYSLGVYSITCPSGRVIPGPPKGSYWRVSKEKFEQLDRDGRIWWGKDGNNVPAPKIFLNEVKQGVVPMTIWTYEEVGHTQDAKKELIEALPEASEVFTTPKPPKLVARIVQLAAGPEDLVLDSFAGSSTTGHAVLSLNRQSPRPGETTPRAKLRLCLLGVGIDYGCTGGVTRSAGEQWLHGRRSGANHCSNPARHTSARRAAAHVEIGTIRN